MYESNMNECHQHALYLWRVKRKKKSSLESLQNKNMLLHCNLIQVLQQVKQCC